MSGPANIAHLLRCPYCHAELRPAPASLGCAGCDAVYPIRDEIAELARVGTSETWTDSSRSESSEAYQRQYHELDEAIGYNEAYRDKRFKRWSTRREFDLLQRLLGSQERCTTLLDLPSGGGRLSPSLEPFTDTLIEADIAIGQLRYARQNCDPQTTRVWMTSSAFHIPLRDEAIDGVVCCRLNHHLPTAEERERLVRELLRVSKRFVIMTFFDYRSIKNYIRRARRPIDHKPPKMTMTVGDLAELSRECGARLVAQPTLSFLFSGHRYALMVKPAAAGPAR